MKDKRPGDKKPNDDTERQRNRKGLQSALVASQFAYTLVIATLLMGWLGHWLGSLLGGGLWSTILMFLLGTAGFVGEMWRMYKFFTRPTDNDGDHRHGNGGQSGDSPSGTEPGDTRLNEGPEGDMDQNRPRGGSDHRSNDDIRNNDDIEHDDDIGRTGSGLSREEIDEIIREIEGLSKEEREEIDRELGKTTDGSPPVDDKDNKGNKGANG